MVSLGSDSAPRIALWWWIWATAHGVGVAAGRGVSLRETVAGGVARVTLAWITNACLCLESGRHGEVHLLAWQGFHRKTQK